MADSGKSALDIATIIAAWWGALVASGVFLWDILKWRWSGPELHVHANGGMVLAAQGMPTSDERYITVTIENRGRGPTTITQLAAFTFASPGAREMGKSKQAYVVQLPGGIVPLPKRLDAGDQWSCFFVQNEEWAATAAGGGVVELGVFASHTDEAIKTIIDFSYLDREAEG